MTILNATEARTKLYKLLDQVVDNPVHIKGERSTAVLVSENDWQAIQETLYLLSIPGMRESLQKGKKEALSECSENLEW